MTRKNKKTNRSRKTAKHSTKYVQARKKHSDMPRKKKSLGQHFLRKITTVNNMIDRVKESLHEANILEIGCGDGFLTRQIVEQTSCKKLISYEIDPAWAALVKASITDDRLEVREQSILDVSHQSLSGDAPFVVLANLPYQITFPVLFMLQQHKEMITQGVVMVQEEVAQKLVAQRGKAYSATSIFLQHHFSFELMEKVEPQAFTPPPKVFSRLVYFKPRFNPQAIPHEERFWPFVKCCFQFPRRTLMNNLKTTHYQVSALSVDTLHMRAQQLSMDALCFLWQQILKNS